MKTYRTPIRSRREKEREGGGDGGLRFRDIQRYSALVQGDLVILINKTHRYFSYIDFKNIAAPG